MLIETKPRLKSFQVVHSFLIGILVGLTPLPLGLVTTKLSAHDDCIGGDAALDELGVLFNSTTFSTGLGEY